MIVGLLALLAAAATQAQSAPGGRQVSPVVVTAPPKDAPRADATVEIGSDQDSSGVVIWPAGALQAGVSGYVTLACRVDAHGLAETCRVAYESPRGRGFGAAALALRPTFKLAPKVGPDGPEPVDLNIAVSFRARPLEANLQEVMASAMGSMQVNGRTIMIHNNPMVTRPMTMMTEPAWAEAPDFDAWAAAYPPEGGGAEGYAVAHCRVDRTGALSHCTVAKEVPAGRGFGKAAVTLASRFRASPQAMASAPHGAPVEVDVPVRFPPPPQAADRTVRAPLWLAGADPQSLARELPPPRDGGKPGRGALVQCHVGAGGALTGCAVELTSPEGMEFDDAAVRLASRLRMNVWSAEAGPVVGGVVHLPVRSDLGEPAAGR